MMTAQELDALKPALEAERARLQNRLAAIDVLLSENGNGPSVPYAGSDERGSPAAPARRDTAPRASGVSPQRVKAVRDILEQHGEMRQREITEALMVILGISEGNASGTTSNALRELENAGIATRTGRTVNKSAVWRYTGPQSRATVVEPGQAPRKGRKQATGKS